MKTINDFQKITMDFSHYKVCHFIVLATICIMLHSCKLMNNEDTILTGKNGTFNNQILHVDNDKRTYNMIVSSKLNLNNKNAIVFAFHGLGIDSKDLMPIYSNLNEMAEKMNAIIVYPGSLNDSWGLNAKQTDKDLKFYDMLLEKIKQSYKIDPNKVHITGMSNGAYFCHILAKNRSESIASVAVHSGMIGLEFIFGINAKRKYPVLLIHGQKDPLFSIETAENDYKKYLNEKHPAKLIKVPNIGHEWASKININDSIYSFFMNHHL